MSTVKIHAQIAPKINYAAHQSSFPVMGELRLENLSTEERIEDLTLKLKASPPFIKEKEWRVDRIEAEQIIEIKNRDLEVDGGFLLELTESVGGQISFQVQKDGKTIETLSKQVGLLAYNEWGGAGFMPELLAAFSMPNDPAVDKILKNASEILRRAGKNPSMDGYKSGNRERVWEIASSIYSAIANLGLTYAQPPASFENDGQKIRLPSRITESKLATCLDTAMLFASVLEQAGLNPIIALPKEHALVGVWLQPEDFSAIVTEEAEVLRKRVDLKEMVVIETTFVTEQPPLVFSKSVSVAKRIIDRKDDATFIAAVDIKQARAHSITPLGLRTAKGKNGASVTGESMMAELPLEESPPLPDFDHDISDDETIDTPGERIERWKKKLLDLTARNPLLNHRATSLEIICPKSLPKLLTDKLLTEKHSKKQQIKILPGLGNSIKKQDEEIHRQRTGDEITLEFAKEKLRGKTVLAKLDKEEFGKRSIQIYRKTQAALQEGGANTLYLALGFLVWKRARDERRFRAPLILIPVALERRSVISNIEMSAQDDEPRFNTTLLEMLRRDFEIDIPGLDKELPMNNGGVVDVDGIWEKIRKRVKDVAGFEVVEDVVLGHFSFAKYLMWKDLADRTDLLKEHNVVRHLIDGVAIDRRPMDRIAPVDPSRVDVDYKPSDFLTPFLADASQMAAIATAERGKNFIIIGPPGTGKSQTIANMIAHFLGKGKKVLFVSEKTAALEVVYRRLEKEWGLGRFCLQLHSNKARKADVVDQLKNCLEVAGESHSEEWKRQARKLKRLRDALNEVVGNLHKKRRNGLTAHYALGVKIRDENSAQHVEFSWPNADYHDETDFESMRATVKELSIQAQAIKNISESPFRLVKTIDWSPGWERQVIEHARNLSEVARETSDVRDALCGVLDIVLENFSMRQVYALGELAGMLIEAYQKQVAWVLDSDGESKISAMEDAARRLEIYNEAQSHLSCTYKPFAWRELDGEAIGLRWTEATSKWWLPRFFAKRRIVKEMRLGGAQGKPAASQDAKILAQLRREGEEIDKLDEHLTGLKDWSQYATDPEVAKRLCDLGRRIRRVIARLVHGSQGFPEIRAKIRNVLHDGNDLLAPDAAVGNTAYTFQEKLDKLRNSIQKFRNHISDTAVSDEIPDCFLSLEHAQRTLDGIVSHHQELKEWCEWQKQRAKAVEFDLLPLVEAIENGHVDPESEAIKKLFEAAYCVWWSNALLNEDDALRKFSKHKHEAKIKEFCQIDDEYRKKTAEYIVANIAGNASAQDDDHSRQLNVVDRETRKIKRHLPIRQLLERASDAVMRLSPCFMMSPLSVVQYLSPNQAFDVVIFDEASQIPVWDAIGAIARGKQVIVAGDPKQMPPTNFFERSDDDPGGDVDMEGDLESILDEILTIGIHKHILRLHYRSRKESLIAFSNARYYHNELVTFPSPNVVDKGIRLVKTEGFYERGGTRQNKGEAKAIVKEIVERLTHPTKAVRDLSIGVVTFNSEQQRLIEDLLDRERSENSEVEWAFSGDPKEPVFVKNLETVQGDERDVILFSITYGPDQVTGRVPMNFGPLNREGGERRLNVAMTRARSEMIVFSTLDPDQLDLSRTQAHAVKDLKDFLRYAEQGHHFLGLEPSHATGDFESPFEMAVARSLREKDWKVHPQVGVSNYRIDLGIVHPDLPGRYLAGVECDGAMYHSGASAKERDKIRQIILEGLGWKLLRVWSTDWWVNKRNETKILIDSLNKILEKDRQARSSSDQKEPLSCKEISTDAENQCDTTEISVNQENISPETGNKANGP